LREWLIFSTQPHRMLITTLLSPSQKQCETNPSREWKNTAVFANRISWRKIAITSLTEVTAVSTTNLRHERKKSLLVMLQKVLYAGSKLARNILTKLSPRPARPEKPDQTYNSAPCQKFHSKSSTYMTTQNYIWESKCTTVNWKKRRSFTFSTKRMSNKTRCDASVKQMFRNWMKTSLHCGFG